MGAQLNKKWVFHELVESETDVPGLLGYALYKKEKADLAKKLKDDGKDDQIISAELSKFHEQALVAERIKGFKSKGLQFLDQIVREAEKTAKLKCDAEVLLLKKEHEKNLKAAEKKIASATVAKMKDYATANMSWSHKIGGWLLDGVSGVVATTLVSIVFFGSVILLTSEQTKSEIAVKALKEVFGVDVNNQVKSTDK